MCKRVIKCLFILIFTSHWNCSSPFGICFSPRTSFSMPTLHVLVGKVVVFDNLKEAFLWNSSRRARWSRVRWGTKVEERKREILPARSTFLRVEQCRHGLVVRQRGGGLRVKQADTGASMPVSMLSLTHWCWSVQVWCYRKRKWVSWRKTQLAQIEMVFLDFGWFFLAVEILVFVLNIICSAQQKSLGITKLFCSPSQQCNK